MRLVLLGAGVMGESILAGALGSVVQASEVTVVERRGDRAAEIAQRYGVAVAGGDTADAGGVSSDADLVLVAVKPLDVPAALASLSDLAADAVVLSVAAGLTTAQIEAALPGGQPVVRAMPNTPALVAAGVTAISPGSTAQEAHLATATALLSSVGLVVEVQESQMDAVTAVSGSGPAYVFLVVEALVEAGVRAGLPRDLATTLTVQTLAGSARMLVETGERATVLRERVTSPGGTTAAALHELERHGLRAAFIDAVLANRDRAAELAAGGRH